MKCGECGADAGILINGKCGPCADKAQVEWQERYHKRMPVDDFSMRRLVNIMLDQLWQHECEIIEHYMPPYPSATTTPRCVIRHIGNGEVFLRHSRGPLQGFFWDVYGEDFHTPELALWALAHAPAPRGAMCVPTHGK